MFEGPKLFFEKYYVYNIFTTILPDKRDKKVMSIVDPV